MEIKKCSNCGKIEEISTFDPVCRCECGGIFYNDEDYEIQETKICPECQSPWDIINNRCTANCQIPITERIL
jgi:hypothetical protein